MTTSNLILKIHNNLMITKLESYNLDIPNVTLLDSAVLQNTILKNTLEHHGLSVPELNNDVYVAVNEINAHLNDMGQRLTRIEKSLFHQNY